MLSYELCNFIILVFTITAGYISAADVSERVEKKTICTNIIDIVLQKADTLRLGVLQLFIYFKTITSTGI